MRCEHTLACEPQQAWNFIAEEYFANHSAWDPAIVDMVKRSSGPVGVGTIGEETRKFVGKQQARFEVTEFVPPQRFSLRNTSGPFDQLQRLVR